MESGEGNNSFPLTNTLYQEIEAIKSVSDTPPSKMQKNTKRENRERESLNCSQVNISNITTTPMIHTFRSYFCFPRIQFTSSKRH